MADKRKHDEAVAKLKSAERCLKTNIIKWKPDYEEAAKDFYQAAVGFKNCRSYELSKECFIKASESYKHSRSFFNAAKSLDNAILMAKEANAYREIGTLAEKASCLHQQNGCFEAALSSLEKGGKFLEINYPQEALSLYQRASEIAIGEENIKQAGENAAKISRLMVKLKLYDQAADAIRREIALYQQTDNNQVIGRLTCCLVLVQLARGDIVAAEKAFKEWGNCCDSPELQNLELLLRGFDDEDPELVKKALSHSFFRHMDVEYTRLIREIVLPVGSYGPKPALVRENAAEAYVSPNAPPPEIANPRPSTSAMADTQEQGYVPRPKHCRPKLCESDSSQSEEEHAAPKAEMPELDEADEDKELEQLKELAELKQLEELQKLDKLQIPDDLEPLEPPESPKPPKQPKQRKEAVKLKVPEQPAGAQKEGNKEDDDNDNIR